MGNIQVEKQARKKRRVNKIRKKVFGSSVRPRITVKRSLKHIYAQIINDDKGITLVSATDTELTKSEQKLKKLEQAMLVGKLLAQKAVKIKIKNVVFDRQGYQYHGRVKALAQGLREEGLEF